MLTVVSASIFSEGVLRFINNGKHVNDLTTKAVKNFAARALLGIFTVPSFAAVRDDMNLIKSESFSLAALGYCVGGLIYDTKLISKVYDFVKHKLNSTLNASKAKNGKRSRKSDARLLSEASAFIAGSPRRK